MPWFTPVSTLSDPLPIQQVALRQGDRLSAFAAVVEDEYGEAIDLTDSRCYLTLRSLSSTHATPMLDRVELTIESPATDGLVTYDFQTVETMGATPGIYDVVVDIEWFAGANSGETLSVPSRDQQAVVILASSIAGGYFLADVDGALVPDGSGGFEIYDPSNIPSNVYVLQADGTYELQP